MKRTSSSSLTKGRAVLPQLGGLALVLAGCSAGAPPRDAIATADVALNQAIGSRAAEYASLELRLAREKLDRAKSALNDEDYEQARRLAEEARVDARLAEATALSQAARQNAQEAQGAIETLRRELERGTTTE